MSPLRSVNFFFENPLNDLLTFSPFHLVTYIISDVLIVQGPGTTSHYCWFLLYLHSRHPNHNSVRLVFNKKSCKGIHLVGTISVHNSKIVLPGPHKNASRTPKLSTRSVSGGTLSETVTVIEPIFRKPISTVFLLGFSRIRMCINLSRPVVILPKSSSLLQ